MNSHHLPDSLSHPGPTFWCYCLQQARCQQRVVADSISIDISTLPETNERHTEWIKWNPLGVSTRVYLSGSIAADEEWYSRKRPSSTVSVNSSELNTILFTPFVGPDGSSHNYGGRFVHLGAVTTQGSLAKSFTVIAFTSIAIILTYYCYVTLRS